MKAAPRCARDTPGQSPRSVPPRGGCGVRAAPRSASGCRRRRPSRRGRRPGRPSGSDVAVQRRRSRSRCQRRIVSGDTSNWSCRRRATARADGERLQRVGSAPGTSAAAAPDHRARSAVPQASPPQTGAPPGGSSFRHAQRCKAQRCLTELSQSWMAAGLGSTDACRRVARPGRPGLRHRHEEATSREVDQRLRRGARVLVGGPRQGADRRPGVGHRYVHDAGACVVAGGGGGR